jgi:hypothetical protein
MGAASRRRHDHDSEAASDHGAWFNGLSPLDATRTLLGPEIGDAVKRPVDR